MGSPRRGRPTASPKSGSKSSSPVPSPGSWNNIARGRSRVRRPSNPFSENSLRRRGYHALESSFGKTFHVERRWKLVREMGSGAYGVVISAADDISGETVAIKLVTRIFDKVQLAKRALREITLLRHFAGHENITGLIDVDAISPDFNEIYIFMEPMEADLHQIIKSGQSLSNEHVQYFLYQILRGMKFIHSASVIHRDLKPGNLLVNSDCELKICDFGLARGFASKMGENASNLTEYVATRWYRAPEIMLAFNRYSTAIDVWSIGCILAELLLGKPLFKGKDYVDQLNKILDILGTPDEAVIERIGSEKAQQYVRSLPTKKAYPFRRLLPAVDPSAIDLLTRILSFDPSTRITVPEALEHPWLASYHDASDEPDCPHTFEKWTELEKLETLDQFREALWKEIEEYRKEVRGIGADVDSLGKAGMASSREAQKLSLERRRSRIHDSPEKACQLPDEPQIKVSAAEEMTTSETKDHQDGIGLSSTATVGERPTTPIDPLLSYARRTSILGGSRVGSAINSPLVPSHQPLPATTQGSVSSHPQGLTGPGSAQTGGGIAFPTYGRTESYIIPARSRTASMAGGGELPRKLLRTLSTVSIHESIDGLPGGLSGLPEIGKYIVGIGKEPTGAEGPLSEMPGDFRDGIEEGEEETSVNSEEARQRKEGKFHFG